MNKPILLAYYGSPLRYGSYLCDLVDGPTLEKLLQFPPFLVNFSFEDTLKEKCRVFSGDSLEVQALISFLKNNVKQSASLEIYFSQLESEGLVLRVDNVPEEEEFYIADDGAEEIKFLYNFKFIKSNDLLLDEKILKK